MVQETTLLGVANMIHSEYVYTPGKGSYYLRSKFAVSRLHADNSIQVAACLSSVMYPYCMYSSVVRCDWKTSNNINY